jgi:hypothetical protein
MIRTNYRRDLESRYRGRPRAATSFDLNNADSSRSLLRKASLGKRQFPDALSGCGKNRVA